MLIGTKLQTTLQTIMMTKNRKIDFSTNLSYTRIERKMYKHCTFTGVNMNDSRFHKCVFIDCTFLNCNLSYTTFESCIFRDINNDAYNCRFKGSNLHRTKFVLSSLRFNEFESCILDDIKLYDSSFEHVKIDDNCSIWDIRYNSYTVIDKQTKNKLELFNTNI